MSAKKRKKGKKEEHKDKFDENISKEGMGTVDNEGVSEETGMNRGKKNNQTKGGDGIEEFVDGKTNFRNGEKDENKKDN